ncbi:MAG: hypothetical protein K2P70_13615 [Hyphomonadaceae bacterium]|nr:hypothetical protein [Hyphomonadaceae bacterium]
MRFLALIFGAILLASAAPAAAQQGATTTVTPPSSNPATQRVLTPGRFQLPLAENQTGAVNNVEEDEEEDDAPSVSDAPGARTATPTPAINPSGSVAPVARPQSRNRLGTNPN